MKDDMARGAAESPQGRGRLVELDTGNKRRWDDFVRASDGGTFYHLAGWRTIFENELKHRTFYIYCEDDGEITGVLPLVQVKSLLFGNALISVPFLVYGGVVAAHDAAADLLIDKACSLARELRVDYLELRNRKPLTDDVPDRRWHPGPSYVTFRKRMSADPEENLAAVPRKQRAMIRKGINAGLAAEIDEDTDRLYAAMLECKRNLGTPFFAGAYLQSIKDTFGKQVEITTVTRGSDVVSSVMSFRFRNEILPYYGGGGDLARDLKGNDFMYWKVMERAALDGVEIFDYGRSMADTGAYRFKKHWGFEPEPLAYQYFLVQSSAVPNLNPANAKYRLLIEAWKRLPLPVAAAVGPFVARRIG